MPARLAGLVLGVALIAIVATFGLALTELDDGDVPALGAAVVSAIATVVVAFFGIHVAEAGRRDAEAARARSEQLHLFELGRVRRLATATTPEERAAIITAEPPV
jgi:hypothetical protein